MHFRILIFGYDTTLLRTRQLILSKAGFDTLTTTQLAEACRILSGQTVDLLILCHTLHETERKSILALARVSQETISVLTLVANASSYTTDGQDGILSTLDGPDILLAALHRLTDAPGRAGVLYSK
jgi:DNA-binding response OmpR family regulator